ncbi:MAG: hypothetical protein ACI9HK_006200 [Pirellulaceae bacterium]|jgi:hypothetical protein
MQQTGRFLEDFPKRAYGTMSDEKPAGENPFSDNPYLASNVPPPENPSGRQNVSALDAIIPTNPLAAIACYSGIFSILCCFGGILLGPIAIVTGILGLRIQMSHESSYGATTSKIRAWIGIVTGIIGFIVGCVALTIFAIGQ